MKEDIITKNSKGKWHGYQERYDTDGKLWLRATIKNNFDCGYLEYHTKPRSVTRFHIR